MEIYYEDILRLHCFNISKILTDNIPQVINHPVILNPSECWGVLQVVYSQ